MVGATSLVTHPIALSAYVLSLVFGLIAKSWNPKSRKPPDRQLFRLAVFLSVTALAGGLGLAWYQASRAPASPTAPLAGTSPAANPSSAAAIQTSTGNQSSNFQHIGGGVTVQYSNGAAPPKKEQEGKKK